MLHASESIVESTSILFNIIVILSHLVFILSLLRDCLLFLRDSVDYHLLDSFLDVIYDIDIDIDI